MARIYGHRARRGARSHRAAPRDTRTWNVRCEDAGMSPSDVRRTLGRALNAGDADGLAALYHDDAVNHQVAEAPVEGRAAIRDRDKLSFLRLHGLPIPSP
jgi:hypothetical protein